MVGVRSSVIFLHNERTSILILTVLLERKELRLQDMLAVPKPIDTASAFSPRQFACFRGEFPCRLRSREVSFYIQTAYTILKLPFILQTSFVSIIPDLKLRGSCLLFFLCFFLPYM